MNTLLNPPISPSWQGIISSHRRLGDGIVPARRLYFLDFPLLLLSVGLITWLFPTDSMLLVSASTGAAVGLYTLWEIAIRRKPIRFSHVFCIAQTVGYGLGVVNSWLTITRGNLGLAEYFHRTPEAVSHAMAAVLIASGVLYSLGEIYETPVFGQNFRLQLDNRAVFFSLFGTAIVIIGYLTGDLSYMGVTASANGGHVSMLMAVLNWLFPTLFAFTALSLLEWPKSMAKRFLGALLTIQFVLIIPTGRRGLLYFVLLATIATRFSTFRPKWSLPKKFVYATVIIVFVSVGAMAFYYLRVAGWGRQKISLLDRISLAMTLYESGNTAKTNESLKENLEKRTFVLGYLSDVLDASFRMEPAMGRNALHEFQLTVPSAFWANKNAYLYQEEDVANMTYNFAFKDEANSLYTAGAIDFGIWGMILYPIIISALFRFVAEIARVNLPEVVSTIVILLLVLHCLTTEEGLWVCILAIRDSSLYAAILWAFFTVPAFSFTGRREMRGLDR